MAAPTHVESLEALRTRVVEERRALVANPAHFNAQKAEIIELQQIIAAIDGAIADEQSLEGAKPAS